MPATWILVPENLPGAEEPSEENWADPEDPPSGL